jgi:hypothetical protein
MPLRALMSLSQHHRLVSEAFLRSCEHMHNRGGPDMFKHGGVGILVPNALSSAASIVAFERERSRLLHCNLVPWESGTRCCATLPCWRCPRTALQTKYPDDAPAAHLFIASCCGCAPMTSSTEAILPPGQFYRRVTHNIHSWSRLKTFPMRWAAQHRL